MPIFKQLSNNLQNMHVGDLGLRGMSM